MDKVTFDVGEHETLSSTLDRAVTEFGVAVINGHRFRASRIAFYRSEDEGGYSGRRSPSVELVDDAGRAIWHFGLHDPEVTIGALVRSGNAGALDGDPLRPYLILEGQYGNGIFFGFDELFVALDQVREALRFVAEAYGATKIFKAIWDRFRRVPETVERNKESWRDRRAFPHDIHRFIVDREPWRGDDLARLLGCSQEQAEAFLTGLGFAYDKASNLWHRGDDPAAKALRRVNRAYLRSELVQ
jgi:hypothetical protein